MSPVTACLLALLTVGFLVVKQDALVLEEVEADALVVQEAERGVSETITQLTQEMEACADNEDMDCILAYFADDVRTMREGAAGVDIGKAETRKHMKWIEQDLDITKDVLEITPSTDESIVVEQLIMTMKFPNGTYAHNWKGLFVWKKVNNDYKIYIDIFNDN
ncbi:uncharacterized protein LOC119722163 [Patiria miniata]|uniref:DUF4440 domain-containing protein n=1 Tax=Patiria miniata TaxID=46514 RepID=A0A913Z8L4_PATMI|nr:uncharacterized protein LOC119722163 [Patiria miniata]